MVHHVQQGVLFSQLIDGDDVLEAQARFRVKTIKTIMRHTAQSGGSDCGGAGSDSGAVVVVESIVIVVEVVMVVMELVLWCCRQFGGAGVVEVGVVAVVVVVVFCCGGGGGDGGGGGGGDGGAVR